MHEESAKVSQPGENSASSDQIASGEDENRNAVTIIPVAESGEERRSLLLRREGRR